MPDSVVNKERRKAGKVWKPLSTAALFPAFLLFLFIAQFLAVAEESEPEARPGSVAIEFALPAMEGGTVSLGVYDAAGKLVRVLHREAPETDFIKGLNGFITYWDGKDDAGKQVAPGRYAARGYVVGDVTFEGEAFLFNDWIDDAASPRIRRIKALRALPRGALWIEAELRGGETASFVRDQDGKLTAAPKSENAKPESPDVNFPGVEHPVDVYTDGAGKIWVIDRGTDGVAVKQFSSTGEFLRRLAIKPGDPIPVKISAAPDADTIYLIEENAAMQRVRGLSLDSAAEGAEPAVSKWRVILDNSIQFNDEKEQVLGQIPTATGEKVAFADKFTAPLIANPLKQQDKPAAEIAVGFDKSGSFLKSTDGLPLRRVSDTPGLRWAVLAWDQGKELARGIKVFQSDGAVVEEFGATGLENMIAIDCGEFDSPTATTAPAKDKRRGAL